MSTAPDDARTRGPGPDGPDHPDGIESTERYETDDGVVFFDAANPLAWLEAEDTLRLDDHT